MGEHLFIVLPPEIIQEILDFADIRDVLNNRLANKYLKAIVDTTPTHLFIYLLRCLVKGENPEAVNSKANATLHHLQGLRQITIHNKKIKRRKEDAYTKDIITKFITTYYSLPLCVEVMRYFSYHWNIISTLPQLLQQYSSITPQQMKDSPLIQRILTYTRILKIIKSHSCILDDIVTEAWVEEKEWDTILYTSNSTQQRYPFRLPLPFLSIGTILKDEKLLDSILNNRGLFLFLLCTGCFLKGKNGCLQQFLRQDILDRIVRHPQWQVYKTERQFQYMLLSNCNEEFVQQEFSLNDCDSFQEALHFVQSQGVSLRFINQKWRKDKRVVLEAVQNNCNAYYDADISLQKDEDVILEVLKSARAEEVEKILFEYLYPYLMNNKDLMKRILHHVPRLLLQLPSEMQTDRELVIVAMKKASWVLLDLPNFLDWTNDFEILSTLPCSDLNYYFLYPEVVRIFHSALNDGQFRLLFSQIVSQKGSAIQWATPELLKNRKLGLQAVSNDGDALKYLSSCLRDDFEIVTIAVANSASAIQYASNRIIQNRELLKILVQMNGYCFYYVYSSYKHDRRCNYKTDKEMILLAVRMDPVLYFNGDLANDKDVIQAKHDYFYGVKPFIYNRDPKRARIDNKIQYSIFGLLPHISTPHYEHSQEKKDFKEE